MVLFNFRKNVAIGDYSAESLCKPPNAILKTSQVHRQITCCVFEMRIIRIIVFISLRTENVPIAPLSENSISIRSRLVIRLEIMI